MEIIKIDIIMIDNLKELENLSSEEGKFTVY